MDIRFPILARRAIWCGRRSIAPASMPFRHLYRGAWRRHGSWRSDRSRGADASLPAGHIRDRFSASSARSNRISGIWKRRRGIAGLTKVVAADAPWADAPSLHAREPNPAIPFAQTPFIGAAGADRLGGTARGRRVVLWRWRLQRPCRRRGAAGLRSRGGRLSGRSEIVVLSARTQERLLAYAGKLLRFLSRGDAGTLPALRDLAFTLQTGREAMEWRVGFIVRTLDELKGRLAAVSGGEPGPVRVDRSSDALARITRDEDMQAAFDAWARKRKLGPLLDAWIAGAPLDWETLHGDPRRAASRCLPILLRRKDTGWPARATTCRRGTAQRRRIRSCIATARNLCGLRFTTELSAQTRCVRDHVIGGNAILPGVAFLEMARAAAELVSGTAAGSITHVAWARPVVVAAPSCTVHIGLADAGEGMLRVELYSTPSDGDPVVHADAIARPGPVDDGGRIDLDRLRARAGARRFDGATCYGAFEAMGVAYAPRTAASWSSSSRGRDSGAAEPARCGVAIIGGVCSSSGHSRWRAPGRHRLLARRRRSEHSRAMTPFALDEMRIYAPCAGETWAWIRRAPDGRTSWISTSADAEGGVLATMRGVTFRSAPTPGLLLARPEWVEAAVTAGASSEDPGERRVMLAGLDPLPSIMAEVTPFDGDAIALSFRSGGAAGLRLCAQRRARAPDPAADLVPSGGPASLLRGLSGLLRSARHENPQFAGQVIEIDTRRRQVWRKSCRGTPHVPTTSKSVTRRASAMCGGWRETDAPPGALRGNPRRLLDCRRRRRRDRPASLPSASLRRRRTRS